MLVMFSKSFQVLICSCQVTDGQLEWSPMDDNFDVATIGLGENLSRFPVPHDCHEFARQIKTQFPKAL